MPEICFFLKLRRKSLPRSTLLFRSDLSRSVREKSERVASLPERVASLPERVASLPERVARERVALPEHAHDHNHRRELAVEAAVHGVFLAIRLLAPFL